MAQPSSALTTQRPDIASAFEEFDLAMNMADFIATRVFPVVTVAKQSGQFGKVPIEQLLVNRDTERAPGSGYARGDFKFEVSSYSTIEHGAEDVVDDREREMYGEFVDPDVYAALRAMSAIMVNQEMRVAAAVFNATTWNGATLTTGITHEWDDYTNAVPLSDVEAAVQKVYTGSGLWPNALVINRKVFRNLRNCAQVRDLIKYQDFQDARPGQISAEALGRVFDLQVIVAGGTKNSANEGLAASTGPIWSDEYAMVCRIPTTSDFREPCIGRMFHWAGDGSSMDGRVESYREEAVRGDVIRVRHDVDEIVLYPQAGHLLSNVTT